MSSPSSLSSGNNPFSCPVCLENYGTDHVPTSFPCGHSCCLEHARTMSRCPICRAAIPDTVVPNYSLRDGATEFFASRQSAAPEPDADHRSTSPSIISESNADFIIPELKLSVSCSYPQPLSQASIDYPILGGGGSSFETISADSYEEVIVNTSLFVSDVDQNQRAPADIVVVVDVSGSMGSEAAMPGSSSNEHASLSLLDIVKHAVKTIIKILGEHDRLAIVTYSNNAQTVFPLSFMTTASKERGIRCLSSIEPDGMTNLWDGLRTGLDILKNRDMTQVVSGNIVTNRTSAVLLLTDGEPNVEPPRGHIPTLKRYPEHCPGGKYPGIVSTFGFGYSLDSVLLSDIAGECQGMYAFIPDSGFVGTAFVHAVSNILSTVATECTLTLEFADGVKLLPNGVLADKTYSLESYGVYTVTGSVSFGQSIDTCVKLAVPVGFTVAPLRAQLTFKPTRTTLDSGRGNDTSTTTKMKINSEANFIPQSLITEHKVALQMLRSELISFINKVMEVMKAGNLEEAKVNLDALSTRFRDWLSAHAENASGNNNEGSISSRKRIEALFQDLSGQISEAVSRQDWFLKWGRHYLPSLKRAHELQQANNFKDPGIQYYGGSLFNSIRDRADDIFSALPPPIPSPSPYSYRPPTHSGSALSSAPPPPISMASYNSRNTPCFHEDALVSMADGTTKCCRDVMPGDKVMTGLGVNRKNGIVKCIVQTLCSGGKTVLCHIPIPSLRTGDDLIDTDKILRVTPWHPIRRNDKWVFPAEEAVAGIREVDCRSIYSFLVVEEDSPFDGEVYDLKPMSSIVIDGCECITLAHGIKGDVVASHSFFGTIAVIKSMSTCRGWKNGLISFSEDLGCVKRDESTGLVNSFDVENEIFHDYEKQGDNTKCYTLNQSEVGMSCHIVNSRLEIM